VEAEGRRGGAKGEAEAEGKKRKAEVREGRG